MPWDAPSKSFIRQNTDFSGPTVWQQDQQATIKIIASRHDNHDQDIAGGITATLNLDGINSMRTALDVGGFQVVNMADATVDEHAVTLAQMNAAIGTTAGNIEVTALTWAANVLTAVIAKGDQTVTIEDFDSIKSGGLIMHKSDVFASGPTVFAVNTLTVSRWTLPNDSGNITINFERPTGVDAYLGENYTVEGSVLVTNGNTSPGVISITGDGVAVPPASILGSNPLNNGEKALLSYIIHRHAGDSYDELYVWSAQ